MIVIRSINGNKTELGGKPVFVVCEDTGVHSEGIYTNVDDQEAIKFYANSEINT